MRFTFFTALLALIVTLLTAATSTAQPSPAPTSHVRVQQLPSLTSTKPAPAHFNIQKAVNAYLATVKGEARARSDAYFEGGYVLLVVDTAYTLGIMALLLWLGISGRMRDFAQSLTTSRFWQVPVYVALFVIVTTILGFPLAVYEGFFREHAYGLSNMSFVQWLGDFAKSFGLQLVGSAILLTLIYAAIRASRRYWWVWGWLIAMTFMVLVLVIAPVFLAPIFNKYYPLAEGPVKAEILSLARSNGIPAHNVYEFDASRQSKRISANVSGFLGTTQISMTDNLIKRATPREIYAVLGHEMGHYVLNHAIMDLTWLGALFLIGFAFVNWGFAWLTGLFGGAWGVRGIDDPAGLPVLVALITFYTFIATPIENTITRTTEAQADIFGLNTARQPDGFATVTLKLSEYRKLDPSPLEEFVLYDHPSGRSRITMAMRWKAEHLNDADIKAGPVSPQ
jgi:STE24 endopeptidase